MWCVPLMQMKTLQRYVEELHAEIKVKNKHIAASDVHIAMKNKEIATNEEFRRQLMVSNLDASILSHPCWGAAG